MAGEWCGTSPTDIPSGRKVPGETQRTMTLPGRCQRLPALRLDRDRFCVGHSTRCLARPPGCVVQRGELRSLFLAGRKGTPRVDVAKVPAAPAARAAHALDPGAESAVHRHSLSRPDGAGRSCFPLPCPPHPRVIFTGARSAIALPWVVHALMAACRRLRTFGCIPSNVGPCGPVV